MQVRGEPPSRREGWEYLGNLHLKCSTQDPCRVMECSWRLELVCLSAVLALSLPPLGGGSPSAPWHWLRGQRATGRSPKGPEGVPASPLARGRWWWTGEEMATSWVEWNNCLCKEVEHLLPHFGEAASPLHEFESQGSGWSICIGKSQYHWGRGDDLLRMGGELGFQNWETATGSSTQDVLNGCARGGHLSWD